MPTGYTNIIDEKDADFPTFLWRCVRAMGVCILQRDEDTDVPARDREVSDYYERSLREARERLAMLEAMTDAEADAAAEKDYRECLARREAHIAEYTELSARYARMRAHVETWKPPTSEHDGFKRFMLEQLSTGGPTDCSAYYKAERLPGVEWRAKQRAEAKADVERASVRVEEEAVRCRQANEWLARLRESVPQPEPTRDAR